MKVALFEDSPEILEVTLRDGSYLIDFQFTVNDTFTIASALEALGFHWIEVGHGVGLHASTSGKGDAAATDEEYLEATSQAIKTARWGMFFIPGIGRIEDLRLAAGYNMGFVRIGTDITAVQEAKPFIREAKDLGLIVSYNAMKSYAVSPTEFGRCGAMVKKWGADILCLVDSAGGMFPDDVTDYMKAAKEESDIPLGFHGHDNLSLAVANSLRAIEWGAVLVDTSLQGMGRSSGNTCTEIILTILQKKGLLTRLNLNAVMDFAQSMIRPLMGQGLDPLGITVGSSRFHSSFTGKVRAYAEKHDLDMRDLISRLCQETLVDAPDDLLEQLSHELASKKMPRVIPIPVRNEYKPRDLTGQEALISLLSEIRPQAIKTGKFSALNIVVTEDPLDDIDISGNIQNTNTHIIGSLSLNHKQQLLSVLKTVDGRVDLILLDVDPKPGITDSLSKIARSHLHKSLLLTYLDSKAWINAIEDQVVRLSDEVLDDSHILIAGNHVKSRFLALRLAERRAIVTLLTSSEDSTGESGMESIQTFSLDPSKMNISFVSAFSPDTANALAEAAIVVVWPGSTPWFGKDEARHLSPGTYLLDAGIGGILPEGLELAQNQGVRLIRVNIWPALAGVLSEIHESARVCRKALGWEVMSGVNVVSGGAMGRRGDVVVDSVYEPTRVIGVADGRGGVLYHYDKKDLKRVRKVSQEISLRLLQHN